MNDLREKCPWDKKQTIQSLRSMTIEELYELADAITSEDWNGIREELGDLLLHIVFYAKIGTEQQQFTIDDVLNGINHPPAPGSPFIFWGFGFLAVGTPFFWFLALVPFALWLWLWWWGWAWWLGSCNAFAVGLVGGFLLCFVLGWGDMEREFVATFGVINLIFVATF